MNFARGSLSSRFTRTSQSNYSSNIRDLDLQDQDYHDIAKCTGGTTGSGQVIATKCQCARSSVSCVQLYMYTYDCIRWALLKRLIAVSWALCQLRCHANLRRKSRHECIWASWRYHRRSGTVFSRTQRSRSVWSVCAIERSQVALTVPAVGHDVSVVVSSASSSALEYLQWYQMWATSYKRSDWKLRRRISSSTLCLSYHRLRGIALISSDNDRHITPVSAASYDTSVSIVEYFIQLLSCKNFSSVCCNSDCDPVRRVSPPDNRDANSCDGSTSLQYPTSVRELSLQCLSEVCHLYKNLKKHRQVLEHGVESWGLGFRVWSRI